MAYGSAVRWILPLVFMTSPVVMAQGMSQRIQKKNLTPVQIQAIQNHHRLLNQQPVRMSSGLAAAARPYSELEDAGYLFFSSAFEYDSEESKRLMAKNLPAGVELVIFASPGERKDEILRTFAGLIDPARIRVVAIPRSAAGFWTRDGFPVPVWNQQNGMDLVDARYYHGFEPDSVVGGWFKSQIRKHSYFFEGGNFVTNDLGDCVTIDNELSIDIPDEIFRDEYGCKKTIRLPHEKGIGHADESVKFLNSKTLITDHANYARILESHGFETVMMPRPSRKYETYINSLLINGTIYVPVFNEAKDQAALDIYRKAGLNVVPIETISLANDGLGSLHCITMTYPKVPFEVLLKRFGAVEL